MSLVSGFSLVVFYFSNQLIFLPHVISDAVHPSFGKNQDKEVVDIHIHKVFADCYVDKGGDFILLTGGVALLLLLSILLREEYSYSLRHHIIVAKGTQACQAITVVVNFLSNNLRGKVVSPSSS